MVDEARLNEYMSLVGRLEWRTKDVCERLGVHRNTVRGWTRGLTDVPTPVLAYLRLAVTTKDAAVGL